MAKNGFLVVAALICGSTVLADTNPVEVVQEMEHDYGVHHGYRRNHAKGICVIGEFTGLADAKPLSRSPIFDGKAHSVIGRFSEGGGVPNAPDSKNIPRGLGIQIDLGNHRYHNITMINVPIFVAKTPQAFFDSLKAGTPEQLAAYQEKYPESKPFFAFVGGHQPPESYATTSYYSLNAFKFSNADQKEQFVRWEFVPEAGEHRMTEEQAKKVDPEFLDNEITERLKKGPATWTMVASLAEPGDSLVDSTSPWPETRKKVKVATLKLTKAESQKGGPCNTLNYDPTQVSDGIAISDDPILSFRSSAYAVSYGKRLSDPVDKPASPEKKKAKRPVIAP